MSTEKVWFEDLVGFLNNTNYFHIIPTGMMTLEEKLNAIVRFFVYLGVILALLKQQYVYLFFGIVAGMFSIIIYKYEQAQRKRAEKFLEKHELDIVDNQVCSRSTVENPFMNPSVMDITDNPERPKACNWTDERIQQGVETNFEERLFRDVGDLYGKTASQRQFYTVPATTIPNDQDGFAKWCYGSAASCKEGNGEQCYNNLLDDVQRRPGMNSAA